MTRRKDSRRPAGPPQPEPLGSISRPVGAYVPGTTTCHACGSTDLVRIEMGTPGGRLVVFVSCRACERTGWFAADGDGTPLSSEEVAGLRAGGGDEGSR